MSNLFTPTRRVIKLDYWGQPYEATVTGRKEVDYAELWQAFRTRTLAAEKWKEQVGYYREGQHSRLRNNTSNTLKLIEDERL